MIENHVEEDIGNIFEEKETEDTPFTEALCEKLHLNYMDCQLESDYPCCALKSNNPVDSLSSNVLDKWLR